MSTDLERIPVRTIAGEPATLGDYAGKVRLVVNVASQCGLTPQYEALEALYRAHQSEGLEVLGFPANEFGGQEPGTEAEIADFCSREYKVTFPMFAKVVVKGEGQHPLYASLTKLAPSARENPGSDFRAKLLGYGVDPGAPGNVLWNFEKFLVGRNGEVRARFAPDVTPDSELIAKELTAALAAH